jgi:hypothetical protein
MVVFTRDEEEHGGPQAHRPDDDIDPEAGVEVGAA